MPRLRRRSVFQYWVGVSANVDGTSTKKHEKFVPLVAFECGYRNKYMHEDGVWVSDENRRSLRRFLDKLPNQDVFALAQFMDLPAQLPASAGFPAIAEYLFHMRA
ncbi:hypothetical protein ANCCEY_04134 [Ancylostoma ceylanicum]|uniref:Uncharacterized protein n=1 Tax=Ancylostoma ceylanicum TaxID=53326 RepID=A0A0D6MA46_9BILA|nr:hypothetical protein ANCCEY_04134 [Ancylostoma ceylanicum]